MPESKQVAEKQSTDIGEAVSFESEAGAGFEDADRESFAIPFLRIVQKLSPVCDETAGEYIEDAKPGMLIDTVSEELFDGDGVVNVIPCHFRRSFLEWKPKRGGFVAEYDVPTGLELLAKCTKDDKNHDITPEGNDLVDTRTHYVLMVMEDGSTQSVAICMSMTQTKKSKQWMTAMDKLRKHRADGTAYRPATFASIFSVSTVPEKNDQGNWYGWKIKHLRYLDESNPAEVELFKAARVFRDAVHGGGVTVDHASGDEVDVTPDSTARAKRVDDSEF